MSFPRGSAALAVNQGWLLEEQRCWSHLCTTLGRSHGPRVATEAERPRPSGSSTSPCMPTRPAGSHLTMNLARGVTGGVGTSVECQVCCHLVSVQGTPALGISTRTAPSGEGCDKGKGGSHRGRCPRKAGRSGSEGTPAPGSLSGCKDPGQEELMRARWPHSAPSQAHLGLPVTTRGLPGGRGRKESRAGAGMARLPHEREHPVETKGPEHRAPPPASHLPPWAPPG